VAKQLEFFRVTTQVYHRFPALKVLHQSEVPMLVVEAAVGVAFFFLRIPLANCLAGVFSRAGIDNLERQTARLKQHRDKLREKWRVGMISLFLSPNGTMRYLSTSCL
jgi:hypothetical protein